MRYYRNKFSKEAERDVFNKNCETLFLVFTFTVIEGDI